MKYLIPAILLLTLFASCQLTVNTVETVTTQLTISNGSSLDLEMIYWVSDNGRTNWFTKDQVYDVNLGDYVGGLHSGSFQTKSVGSGSNFIYFYFTNDTQQYWTSNVVVVNAGESVTTILTDGTQLLPSLKTELTIINNTSFDLDLIYWISGNGKTNWFNKDSVYDINLGKLVGGLASGSSQTKNVSPGSNNIYFYFTNDTQQYWTSNAVVVNYGESITNILSNSTVFLPSIMPAGKQLLSIQSAAEKNK
jgi:hypothetical protein